MSNEELQKLVGAVVEAVQRANIESQTVPPMYTLSAAAKLMGCSEPKLRRLVLGGDIPYVKFQGSYRVRALDLNDYIKRNTVRG